MEKTSSNALEQFVLLAKNTKGAAVIELIKQVLETPGIYVFSELLDMPNIQELSHGSSANYFELLNIFAFGTYNDYKANRTKLPSLTPSQLNKLRHLTIISMATKNKCLPYTELLKELEITHLRELEDLIIEAIYADIIRGKLDQNHQRLEVDYAVGRDIKPEVIPEIASVLQEWCVGCESLLQTIETQVTKANLHKESQTRLQQQVEQEVANIKKTLKATNQDSEEHMVVDSRESHPASEKSGKRMPKIRGLRGSSSKSSK